MKKLCSKFFFDSHFCKILFLNVLHGLLRIFHNVMMLNFLSSYASSVSLGAVENTFTNFTIDSKESSSTVLHGEENTLTCQVFHLVYDLGLLM